MKITIAIYLAAFALPMLFGAQVLTAVLSLILAAFIFGQTPKTSQK